MSFLDRTISDAYTPAAGIPVRRSPAAPPPEEVDLESAPDVDVPEEEDAQTQRSPLQASGAGNAPHAEEDKDQSEDEPAPEVQTLRRSSIQSAPPVVDETETNEQEPVQRTSTAASPTQSTPPVVDEAETNEQEPVQRTPTAASPAQDLLPRPRSSSGVRNSVHTVVPDGAYETLRVPTPVAAAPDRPGTALSSDVQSTPERASALSHTSRLTSTPLNTTTRAGQKVPIPLLSSEPQFANEPQDSPPEHAGDRDEQGEGDLSAPTRDRPDVLTPTAIPTVAHQHQAPQTSPQTQHSTIERGPIIEIGRLEVIVEAPVAPAAALAPSAPLPMPGTDPHRFSRRL